MVNTISDADDHADLQDLDTGRNTKQLDRKKRDTDSDSGDDDRVDVDDDEPDLMEAETASGNVTENRRRARQLRPPPVGSQQTWQYDSSNAAYDYTNAPASYQSDGLSFNYNPFLTLPSSSGASSQQQFKSGASFYQSNTPKTLHSSYVSSSGRGEANIANVVRDYQLYKVHNGLDATKDIPFTHRGNTGSFAQESYVPLYLSSQNAKKPDEPDNFSYFHIGAGNTPATSPPTAVKKEPAIYIIHKPKPVVTATGGGAPKAPQVIQVSTVGGFFNNNPTSNPYSSNGFKKGKSRPADDHYFGTHKPVYHPKTVAPVYETTYDNKDYYFQFNDQSSEFLPIAGTTSKSPTKLTKAVPVKSNAPGNAFQNAPAIFAYHGLDPAAPTTTKTGGFYITRPEATRPTTPPTKPTTTSTTTTAAPLPWASLSWNSANKTSAVIPNKSVSIGFNKFLAERLRETQFTATRNSKVKNFGPNIFSLSAAVGPTYSSVLGGKGMSWSAQKNSVNVSDVKVHHHKVQTTAPPEPNLDDYYYEDEDEDPATTEVNEVQTSGRVKPFVHVPVRELKPTTFKVKPTPSTAPPTVYTRPPHVRITSTKATFPTTTKPKTTPADDEYYYYDDGWTQPPQNKSQYMPMSETAAPRPRYPTTMPTVIPSKYKFHQIQRETSSIPPIIKFPDDVFHELRPMNVPRYLNKSTIRPYTVRTRLKPTQLSETTTQTVRTTAASTTQKVYSTTADRILNRAKPTKGPKKLDANWEFDDRLPNRYF